jgi:hypothetical protein
VHTSSDLTNHKSFLFVDQNNVRWRMLSFNATESPSSEPAPAPTPPVAPKPRKRWMIAAIIVIVIVVVAGVFAYWWLSRPSAPSETASWVFDGAYAEYFGETTVSLVTMNMTMRLEVVDYNSTHAELLMNMKMESNMMQPQEWQYTSWTDLKGTSYEVEGYTLGQTHEDDVNIPGLGTRHCVVFEYSSSGMTMTYYVDKDTGWPLRMQYSVSEGMMDMDFDMTLTETNIPGL